MSTVTCWTKSAVEVCHYNSVTVQVDSGRVKGFVPLATILQNQRLLLVSCGYPRSYVHEEGKTEAGNSCVD